VAPVEAERIFEFVEPLLGRVVAAVRQPAPRLEEHRGRQETIAIPPVARASGGAAKTEDAFVIPI